MNLLDIDLDKPNPKRQESVTLRAFLIALVLIGLILLAAVWPSQCRGQEFQLDGEATWEEWAGGLDSFVQTRCDMLPGTLWITFNSEHKMVYWHCEMRMPQTEKGDT